MSTDEVRQLREATRAAHEATKDLSRKLREAQQLIDALPAVAARMVDDHLKPEVETQSKALAKACDVAMRGYTAEIIRSFDALTSRLFGSTDWRETLVDAMKLAELKEALGMDYTPPPLNRKEQLHNGHRSPRPRR